MRQRLVAFLLLGVFLGAGTSVPGPDVLFHHLNGHADQLRTHLDPAGGCGGHAERCTLGRAATGAGAAITPAPVLSTRATETPPPALAAAVGTVSADLAALPHSRAPPAHVV
jgi:hypothetical protein